MWTERLQTEMETETHLIVRLRVRPDAVPPLPACLLPPSGVTQSAHHNFLEKIAKNNKKTKQNKKEVRKYHFISSRQNVDHIFFLCVLVMFKEGLFPT